MFSSIIANENPQACCTAVSVLPCIILQACTTWLPRFQHHVLRPVTISKNPLHLAAITVLTCMCIAIMYWDLSRVAKSLSISLHSSLALYLYYTYVPLGYYSSYIMHGNMSHVVKITSIDGEIPASFCLRQTSWNSWQTKMPVHFPPNLCNGLDEREPDPIMSCKLSPWTRYINFACKIPFTTTSGNCFPNFHSAHSQQPGAAFTQSVNTLNIQHSKLVAKPVRDSWHLVLSVPDWKRPSTEMPLLWEIFR